MSWIAWPESYYLILLQCQILKSSNNYVTKSKYPQAEPQSKESSEDQLSQ